MLFLSMTLMLIGTIMMVDNKNNCNNIISKKWIIYAILSAVFASFVSLFVKIGLHNISSSLGMLIRTIIVFLFAFTIVLSKKEYKNVFSISKKNWLFLTLSGLATCASWLLEYYSLNIDGVNPVAVNSIGKLSILITMLFSLVFLKEKFSKKSLFGLLFLTCGIVLIIVFSL